MASGRKRKGHVEEEPAEPETDEEEEEEGEQEYSATDVEEGDEPEEKPRPRRTAKTRAPKRSATAPVPRRRGARKDITRDRDPRQPSLFSRMGQENGSRTATRTIGSILLTMVAIGGMFILFQFFAGSRFFALGGVDVVWPAAKRGVPPLLSAREVEDAVRQMDTVKRGVLKADLEEVRKELMKNPLMREVEVARLLPDRLRVSIIERIPIALARRDSSVVCVDDEGVMFGDRTAHWRGGDEPLISGLAEDGDGAQETNRRLISIYKKLKADLDHGEPPLWSEIDEIRFDKDEDVRLVLTGNRGAVLVGKEDFRTRLNVALDILAAISRKDLETLNVLRIGDAQRLLSGKINYVNVNDPKRPIIGLDE